MEPTRDQQSADRPPDDDPAVPGRQPAEGGREEVDETLRRQQDDEDEEESDRDRRRAEGLAREVATDNPDPTTRREAIEQALEAEGLSDQGEELGQHNE